MDNPIPILLVPGLGGSPRIYAPVLPRLWRFGPGTVANHIRDDSLDAIARRILAEAPPRFALAGHSMGGYIAFEIVRQAPERIARLALINTQARPDTLEAGEKRRGVIARVQAGHYHDVLDELFPGFVHPSRRDDADLRKLVHDMGDDMGADAFVRQQTAIMGRADSRPTLATIGCPTLVLSGDGTIRFRMPCPSKWPGEFAAPNWLSFRIVATFRSWNSRRLPPPRGLKGSESELFRRCEQPKSDANRNRGVARCARRDDMLRDDINNAVKDAMRAKDQRKLSTLRMINSTIKNADIDARGQGKPPLSEGDLLGVLQKMIKQRQESVELYDKGGRAELAHQEREEIAVISSYLPRQMSDDDVKAAIAAAIAETSASGVKDMGKVIGVLKSKYAGQMDFGRASGLVKSALTG